MAMVVVALAIIVAEVDRGDAVQSRKRTLQLSVAGILADLNLR
jgi:hypothetical protein